MYCIKCGNKIENENAKYCKYCGAELKRTEQNMNHLLQGVKEQDESAVREFYKNGFSIAKKCAMSYVNGQNEIAEDIAQNTMIKALDSIQTFEEREGKTLDGWVYQIARNKSVDYLRSLRKRTKDKSEAEEEDQSNPVRTVNFSALDDNENGLEYDPEDTKIGSIPEEKYSMDARDQIVRDVMNGLSNEQKQVLILNVYNEMTINEIAEELGISTSTVIGRLQSAKKNIKTEIDTIQKRDDLKLYNITPVPFFMWLMKHMSETEKAMLASQYGVSQSAAAKAAGKIVEESAKQSVKAAGSSSVSGAASTAGASTVTKIAVGAAIAVTAAGGGYIAIDKISKQNAVNKAADVENKTETKEERETEEDIEATAVPENDLTAGTNRLFSIDIPEGWILTKGSFYGYDSEKQATVEYDSDIKNIYYLYKGSIDPNNQFIAFIANDPITGVGDGDVAEDLCDSNEKEFTYKNWNILYSYSQYGFALDGVEWVNELWNKKERFYNTAYQNDLEGNLWYSILYVDHGQGGIDDKDFKTVLDSFKVPDIGVVRTAKKYSWQDKDILNVYRSHDLNAESDTRNGVLIDYTNYHVYSKYEDENGTWYQIGEQSWILDDGSGLFEFNPNA